MCHMMSHSISLSTPHISHSHSSRLSALVYSSSITSILFYILWYFEVKIFFAFHLFHHSINSFIAYISVTTLHRELSLLFCWTQQRQRVKLTELFTSPKTLDTFWQEIRDSLFNDFIMTWTKKIMFLLCLQHIISF